MIIKISLFALLITLFSTSIEKKETNKETMEKLQGIQ